VTPVVRVLLFANVAAFFLQATQPQLTNLFSFVPRLAWREPWTILTYMFLHGGITHILFNMLSLFWFGPRVEERMGSRRFAVLYFLSGISGAALSFVFAPRSPIIGASAGVFGVMLAFAHYWPNAVIHIWGIIPVTARMLVILTTVAAFWFGLGGFQAGVAHFAHLGGYAGAFIYLKWLDRKRGEFRRRVEAPAPVVAEKVIKWQAIDRNTVHEVNRDEVNRILDKINAQGIGSLTPQERIFLSNFVPDDRSPPVS
jgi:membrane associated rhomboid family serine protease